MPDIGIVGAGISGHPRDRPRRCLVVNDPITGQGANLGSRCAFVLADAIVAGPPYDEALCRKVEMEMCEVLGTPEGAAAWLKGFLQGGR